MLGCTLQLARHNFLDAPSFTISAASGSYRWVVGMLFQTSLWGRTLPLLPQLPLFDGFDVTLHVTRVKHAILHRLLQATGCYALSSDTCGLNLKTKTLTSSCFTTLTPLNSFQEISGLRLWNVWNVVCRMWREAQIWGRSTSSASKVPMGKKVSAVWWIIQIIQSWNCQTHGQSYVLLFENPERNTSWFVLIYHWVSLSIYESWDVMSIESLWETCLNCLCC